MRRVMIVDDSSFMVSVIRNFAEQAALELEIIEAASGEEAVEKYRRFHPELIFMDIKMEGMTGIEALKEINKHGAAKVVMCTSLKEPELERQAREAGAVGYLLKPFQSAEVIAEIEKHLA